MDYIPKIPKEQLVHGTYYRGRCRNASIARWNANIRVFVHWRTKFGNTFLEEICAPEDENRFDVFVTESVIGPEELKEVKEIPFEE